MIQLFALKNRHRKVSTSCTRVNIIVTIVQLIMFTTVAIPAQHCANSLRQGGSSALTNMADLKCQVCWDNIMPCETVRMTLCWPESHYLHRHCWLQMPLHQRQHCLTCRQQEITEPVLERIGACMVPYIDLRSITSFNQAPEEAHFLMRRWQRGESAHVSWI